MSSSSNSSNVNSLLTKAKEQINTSFSKKFQDRTNQHDRLSILESMKNLGNGKPMAQPTIIKQVQAASKYESWFYSSHENENSDGEVSQDPYSEEAFTLGNNIVIHIQHCQFCTTITNNHIDNLTLYAIERSQASEGTVDNCIQVSTVFNDFKHLIAQVLVYLLNYKFLGALMLLSFTF
jgi:hypothetical protein